MTEGNTGARRTEDIALDLLKFIAATTHVGTKTAASGVGFGSASSAKSDDQVSQLLELYGRCRQAVESPAAE
ncbi:MAG: hypothetical protein NVSMB62_12370 [Acidobacteriaceae bacterium]